MMLPPAQRSVSLQPRGKEGRRIFVKLSKQPRSGLISQRGHKQASISILQKSDLGRKDGEQLDCAVLVNSFFLLLQDFQTGLGKPATSGYNIQRFRVLPLDSDMVVMHDYVLVYELRGDCVTDAAVPAYCL